MRLKSVSDELETSKTIVFERDLKIEIQNDQLKAQEILIETERAEKLQAQASNDALARAYQEQKAQLDKEKEQKLQLIAANKAKEDALQTELEESRRRELDQKMLIDVLRKEAEKNADQTSTPVQSKANSLEPEQISDQQEVISKLMQELENKSSQPSPTEAVLAQRLAELEDVNKALRAGLERKADKSEPVKKQKAGFFGKFSSGSKKGSADTAATPSYQ